MRCVCVAKTKHAVHGLHKLQLSHRGSYSVERLKAFDEYCHQVSLWRVVGICLTLPIPALAVAIGMECIPLQDPREGWRANHGAFIRDSLMFFMTCFGLCVQSRQLVPNLSMSLFRMVLVSAATAICSISLRMLVAELWVYPIPFGYAWGATPYSMFVAIFFLIAVGRTQLREKPTLFRQLCQQYIVVMVQVMLCVVYPAYNAVYLRLGPTEQALFVLVLPFLKLVMQNIVAWSTSHVVEYMPGVTVFSVEVFNALYMAKCMQSAGSMLTFGVIMGFDVLKMMLSFRDTKFRMTELYRLMEKHNGSNSDKRFVDTVMEICQDADVLSRRDSNIRIRSPIKLSLSRMSSGLLNELVRKQSTAVEQLKTKRKGAIRPSANAIAVGKGNASIRTQRKRSPAEILPRLDDSRAKAIMTTPMATLKEQFGLANEAIVTGGPSNTRNGRATMESIGKSKSMNQLLETERVDNFVWAHRLRSEVANQRNDLSARAPPEPKATNDDDNEPTPVKRNLNLSPNSSLHLPPGYTLTSTDKIQPLTSAEKVRFTNESLKILFHFEYHALVEYIEAMIPMLYCVYVELLTKLPSRQYYPEMRYMTTEHMDKMVGNIFTYAWLEVLSFILMHYMIKWKFGFSPAYLLAFVLENQAMEFQARLLVWFTYVLEITLVHYGTFAQRSTRLCAIAHVFLQGCYVQEWI